MAIRRPLTINTSRDLSNISQDIKRAVDQTNNLQTFLGSLTTLNENNGVFGFSRIPINAYTSIHELKIRPQDLGHFNIRLLSRYKGIIQRGIVALQRVPVQNRTEEMKRNLSYLEANFDRLHHIHRLLERGALVTGRVQHTLSDDVRRGARTLASGVRIVSNEAERYARTVASGVEGVSDSARSGVQRASNQARRGIQRFSRSIGRLF